MADTTQLTNAAPASPVYVVPPSSIARSRFPEFAVAFLPRLSHRNFTPVQLATAFARCGYGKLVRADYAPCGIFAYFAYTGWRIHQALAAVGGTKVMTKSAHGPFTCIHLLPAHGWTVDGREGEPKVLTDSVESYDLECPDAGEGSWANWESKVQVVGVNSPGDGFAGLRPDSRVEMLRERRWPQPPDYGGSGGRSTPDDTVLVMTIEHEVDRCGVCNTGIYEVPRSWVDDDNKGKTLCYCPNPYRPRKPEELPSSHRCWRRLHASYLDHPDLDADDRKAIKMVWPDVSEKFDLKRKNERVCRRLRVDDFSKKPIFCIFKFRW